MRALSAEPLNRLLRQFLIRRSHRPLTAAEQHEYERLRAAWTAAKRQEVGGIRLPR
jgi:hypothetical protein